MGGCMSGYRSYVAVTLASCPCVNCSKLADSLAWAGCPCHNRCSSNASGVLSGDRAPSIEADDLAGDVISLGGEEVDEVGDVLGGSGSGEGDAGEVLAFFVFGV